MHLLLDSARVEEKPLNGTNIPQIFHVPPVELYERLLYQGKKRSTTLARQTYVRIALVINNAYILCSQHFRLSQGTKPETRETSTGGSEEREGPETGQTSVRLAL